MYEDLELAVMGPSLALVLLGGKTRLATAVDRYSGLALVTDRSHSRAIPSLLFRHKLILVVKVEYQRDDDKSRPSQNLAKLGNSIQNKVNKFRGSLKVLCHGQCCAHLFALRMAVRQIHLMALPCSHWWSSLCQTEMTRFRVSIEDALVL